MSNFGSSMFAVARSLRDLPIISIKRSSVSILAKPYSTLSKNTSFNAVRGLVTRVNNFDSRSTTTRCEFSDSKHFFLPNLIRYTHLPKGCRGYIQIKIKGIDKKIVNRKPGTDKKLPKPPSSYIDKEFAKAPLTYHSMTKNPYNVQNRKILGRGGGRSRYCRRGRKGFKRRHSVKTPICIDYAGGSPPFETYKTPIFGKLKNKLANKGHIAAVSISTLKKYIDAGLIDSTKKITLKSLVKAGVVPRQTIGVRLIPNGYNTLNEKIDIEVNNSTSSVISRIESLGGKITLIPVDGDLMDYYFNPDSYFFEPPAPLPNTIDGVHFYTSHHKRGCLAKYVKTDEPLEDCIAKIKDLHRARYEYIEKQFLSLPPEYPIPEPRK